MRPGPLADLEAGTSQAELKGAAGTADTSRMALSEEELVEASLLRYAQQAAARKGAAWFAAEMERRDFEERRRNDPTPHTLLYRVMTGQEDEAPRASAFEGPVDEAVGERTATAEGPELALERPEITRHAHVPRPPQHEPERRRRRGRRQAPAGNDDAMWMPSAAEIEHMSPAGRRLYGLDD